MREQTAFLPTEAERAVLGCLLLDGLGIEQVKGMLTPEDFLQPEHRIIYSAMLALHAKSKPVSMIFLAEELGPRLDASGGPAYWTGLTLEAAMPTVLLSYVELVQEQSQRVRLHTAMERAGTIDDPEQAIQRLRESLQEVESIRRRVDWDDRKEAAEKLVKWVTDPPTEDSRGLMTGIPILDHYINGMRAKQLIVTAARTGVGKTSLGVTVAHHVGVIRQKPVLFFSAEMGKDEIRQKFLAIDTGIPWKRLDHNTDLNDIERAKAVRKARAVETAPVFVIECPKWTTAEIARWAKIVHTAYPLSLVVADYLQFLHPSTKTESRVQEVSAIARDLKEIAVELSVPLLAMAQLNRLSEHRSTPEPFLYDLKESSEIEQTANVVILLWKDREEDEEASQPEVVWVKVDKNRMGRKGKFQLHFWGDTMRFGEMTDVPY